jgi:hypothetical protein
MYDDVLALVNIEKITFTIPTTQKLVKHLMFYYFFFFYGLLKELEVSVLEFYEKYFQEITKNSSSQENTQFQKEI